MPKHPDMTLRVPTGNMVLVRPAVNKEKVGDVSAGPKDPELALAAAGFGMAFLWLQEAALRS